MKHSGLCLTGQRHPLILVNRLLWLVGLSALVCLLVSCDDPITQFLKQNEAKSGLDALLTQLPKVDNFETIKVEYFEFSDSAYGKTCYYARAYVFLGTSLPLPKALDTYEERLESLGWMLDSRPYEQYETARVLFHGDHDLLVVESGRPGSVMDAEELAALRVRYPSVIFVSLDYMMPQRDGC